MKLHLGNVSAAGVVRLFHHNPEPPAVPPPTTTDLARLGALVDQALNTALGAALEHRPLLEGEVAAIPSDFGRALARRLAARLAASLS